MRSRRAWKNTKANKQKLKCARQKDQNLHYEKLPKKSQLENILSRKKNPSATKRSEKYG